jgi:hypothetical protein
MTFHPYFHGCKRLHNSSEDCFVCCLKRNERKNSACEFVQDGQVLAGGRAQYREQIYLSFTILLLLAFSSLPFIFILLGTFMLTQPTHAFPTHTKLPSLVLVVLEWSIHEQPRNSKTGHITHIILWNEHNLQLPYVHTSTLYEHKVIVPILVKIGFLV